MILAIGSSDAFATVIGARPALIINCVGDETGEEFPATSVTTAVRLQVPLVIVLMSQKFTVAVATKEHDAFSDLVVIPEIVAESPGATPATEIRGVASIDVVAPLSCALKGAALAAGTAVSMVIKSGADGAETFEARSVRTTRTVQAPSDKLGSVHDFSVAVAVRAHYSDWLPNVAVTTARSVALASFITIVGVESNVMLSLEASPVSEEVASIAGRVINGAVVSMVMVNCSDAATIKPAMS